MPLPDLGSHPRLLEELRIGGGYGSAPDGGADFDRSGNAALNGDLTVDGSVATGPLAAAGALSVTVGGNTPVQIRRNASAAFSQLIVPLSMKNAAGDYVPYAELVVKIQANSTGAEEGLLQLGVRKGGAMAAAVVLSSGGIQVTGLPTSTPGASGWLWNDGGNLRIS
jgi:hypothetical protein